MAVLIRIAVGLLLIAHGLVHLLYLVPKKDDPSFPFTLKEFLRPSGVPLGFS